MYAHTPEDHARFNHTTCPTFLLCEREEGKKKKKKKSAMMMMTTMLLDSSSVALQPTTSTSSHRTAQLPKRSRNATARAAISNPATPTEKEALDYYQRTQIPSSEFTETFHGPERYTSVLLHAMRMQWKHGFTHVPSGFRRVTHGFGEILAGMQPAAAERCVELLLENFTSSKGEDDNTHNKESILDPFCGGGTVPVVAMTKNLIAYGTDVSPLALHVCGHRVWVPENVAKEETWLRERMRRIEEIIALEKEKDEEQTKKKGDERQDDNARSHKGGSFANIAAAAEKAILECESSDVNSNNSNGVDSTTRKTALFFCLAEAERRHFVREKRNKRKKGFGKRRRAQSNSRNSDRDDSYYSPLRFYGRCVDEYIFRVKDLHDAVGGIANVIVRKGDARFDDLVPKDKIGTISGILTSPPYPGVYDYVSFARKQRSRFRVGSLVTTKKEEEENKNEGGFLSPTSYYINAEVPNSNELDERGNRKQWSADFSSANEFGSKRELRKDPRAFNDKWLASQTQWLANAYKTLKPSGRMLVMIGDGANVNALRSTVDVAERVGFERLASCSLAVVRTTSTGTVYNGARKEHLILFQK